MAPWGAEAGCHGQEGTDSQVPEVFQGERPQGSAKLVAGA